MISKSGTYFAVFLLIKPVSLSRIYSAVLSKIVRIADMVARCCSKNSPVAVVLVKHNFQACGDHTDRFAAVILLETAAP